MSDRGRSGETAVNGPAISSLPPRLLPVLYFALAHAALVSAFALIAIDPRGVAGFFYHANEEEELAPEFSCHEGSYSMQNIFGF